MTGSGSRYSILLLSTAIAPPVTRLTVRIVRLADFGAFAEVAEGVNGLIPLSEMSWSYRPASAASMVEVGQSVDVVVIRTDAKRRRIGLSR